MAIVTPLSFSPNGEYFAYSSPDGTLKIWETATATLKQEYTPSAHLSATCTCLSWGKISNLEATPKKKKKKRYSKSTDAELELIALGTTSGEILIFSPAKGDLHTQLNGGHTGPVSSICWSNHSNRIFSSSHDQHVAEWDVGMSVLTRKWKADKTAVNSLCLCHTERHLLTAGRTIKLWDLETQQVIQTFTGHATEVFQLIPVDCERCEGAMNGGESVDSSYLFSVAAGDRHINAWQVSSKSQDKGALASFSLPDEAVHVNFRSPSQAGQTFLLTVVTKSGHVVIFENQLNGRRKKPVQPSFRLQVVSRPSRDGLPRPISVQCAAVRGDKDRTLQLAYGSFLKPAFETMVHSALEADMCLEREDASRSVMKLQQSVSKVKVPDMSKEVTFLAPGHMIPHAPTTTGDTTDAKKEQRKRKKSVDLTMEDRMNAIGIDKPSTSHNSKHPPKAEGMATLLAQGLKSQDHKILTSVLLRRDEGLIRNTIRKLPLTLIVPLVQELAKRMHSHAQSGAISLKWVRIVLTLHASYLMSFPGLVDTVSGMYAMMESRNCIFDKLSQLHGKLDLVLSQISSQDIEEDLDDVHQPMLHFQDESSDSEYGMDAVVHDNTESEDSWDEHSAADEEEDGEDVQRTVGKRRISEGSEDESGSEVDMDSDKDG